MKRIEDLTAHIGMPGMVARALIGTSLFNVTKDNGYYLGRNIFNYTYVSESAAPMIGTVRYVMRPVKLIEKEWEVAAAVNFPNEFHIFDQDRLFKAIIEMQKESRKIQPNTLLSHLMEEDRITHFLGSSAKPALTKKSAICEIRNGATDEEIIQKYRCADKKPLPQWRAHVTMGTYEERNDNNEERISKQEVIDLIKSGIPTTEIYATYPSSFTIGQLRAFKKHVTMGTYEKINA